MKYRRTSRFLSIVLLVAMMLTLMPTAALAEDTATTWTQIAFADIKPEDTIAITMKVEDTYQVLPTAVSSKDWPTADETGTVSGTTLTTTADASAVGWTITAGNDGYNIVNAKGEKLYCTADNRGVRIGTNGGDDLWNLVPEGTHLTAKDTKGTARYLGVYAAEGAAVDWRCYTSINNNIKDETIDFWKLNDDSGTPEPTEPPTPTATPEPTEPPAVTVTPIADVLAATEGEFTVKGVVTMLDGRNVYIQDATGGICLYPPTAPTDLALGDTVIGTGSRAEYRGLPELSGGTCEKSSGLTLTAKETSIGALTTADVCTYVSIKDLTVSSVSGSNINLTDAEGKTIQIYKAVTGDTTYAEGDVINFTGAVGIYNTTLQLRNTLAEEITKAETPVEPETSTIAEALAGETGAEFTVKGVVTMLDGRNVYIQDATGGICLYPPTAPTDLALGDTVIGTGSRAEYRGLPELSGGTCEKSSGLTLTAKETSIGALTTADVCTYVSIKDLTVSSVSGSNINLTDAEGKTIQIYKAVTGDTTYAEGDVINFTGAVGIYNTTLQLRNTLAEEITKAETPVEPETSTIAEALAGETGAEFTVKGVVTMLDGRNVYIQDATGGICLYPPTAPTDLALGDTVIGTGSRAEYRGLPELSGGTCEKSSGLTLTAKETSIGALTTADVCTYVSIKDLTVSSVSGSNINLTDAEGKTIQIYKAVTGDTTYAEGDVINFTGAVGIYNTTLQLRNTLASEISRKAEAKTGFVTDLADLTDGAMVVILNPANKKALSQVYSGNYNSGVDVAVKDGVLTGFAATEVWTVGVNADGTYTFSTADGKKLSMATKYSSMSFDKDYPNWAVTPVDGTEGGFFITNTGRSGNRMEWYAEKNYWSCYYQNNEGELFIQQFYLVDEIPYVEPGEGEPANGQQVVIYSATAEGVLGLPNEMGTSLELAAATVENDAAVVSNGALVFTVTREGEDYTFETGGKYLATSDAEDLFLQDSQDAYTKWYLTKNSDGFVIYNRAAKYNGSPVCIEFFSGAFSGWTFKSSDAGLFRFNFYPVAKGTAVVNGVAQVPTVDFACEDSRYVEQDYEVKFTLNDLAPEISDISVTYTIGDTTEKVQEMSFGNKTGTFILPAAVLDAKGVIDSFTITVDVKNSYGLSYTGTKTVQVLDEPFIGKLTPAANAQTMEDKRPVISAEIGNVGEKAVFTMTVNDEPVEAVYADGVLRYQPAEDMADGRYTVIVTAERADGKTVQKMWSFFVGKAQFQLFFGQLHSHTTYSDGSGSLEAALDYISAIPKSANIQFVAFTDHSNYFDSTSAANPEAALYDVSQMTAASKELWDTYKQTAADFNANSSDLIAIAGFEMTWSGGPGHINTFNSPGIVSRNNSTLNNKTDDAGMKAYYALLDNEALVDSLSQFNHPGKTFGNFTDFSYWDAVTDSRIFLVEVGNGEGQIGAGGYYPSYEQYIMALDKGWHVGPTNNQDNHKGRWGNANDARDVILTDDFSEQGLYNAIKLYRIYATEDKNLEIRYTVNGEELGTIFTEIPEELAFSVSLFDPDSSDTITKVELVANSGAVAYTWDDPNEIKTGLLETTLKPTYSYYFVRVTQADGDLAVTAPVWVGESLKLGISAVECGTSTPVTGEEFTLSTTFFNSEASEATVKSIVYTVNGSEVIGTDTAAGTIPASSTKTVEFKYTPTKAKIMTVTVTAILDLDGVEYTFSKDIELQVKDADKLVYIGIDASHYNEYVAGNYKDSMGNFGALAGGYGVRTVELKTSEELIAACSNEKFVAIIFTAPSRRLAAAQSDPRTYSADELAAIAAFNQAGGQVIVCGWGDNYENYDSVKTAKQMAETQNELLAALGSSIRLGDDEVMDDALNGGQAQRLYFDAYNHDHYLMEGVVVDPEYPNDRKYSEVYSNYGGCSVYFEGDGVPATVTPIVYGHASTYTKDCDGDGKNDLLYPYGEENRVVVMASEQLADKGLIIVAGAAFMSNFEVQAAASSGSSDADQQMNYSNYKICENLVKGYNEITVTPIAEVQKQTEIGLVYTIEGTVTSNASGYDKDTAFFDCIYVQDETAGICCFPVSGNFKIGDRVRITGYTDFYQAEMELQVMSIEKIGETDPVQPIEVTAAQINDLSVLGSLVTLKGTVESFEYENGLIQTILVKDAAGNIARVFIDGYITTAEDVKDLAVGCRIQATGLSSYDDTWKNTNYFPRIRVRNRADIVCTAASDAAVVYGRTLLLQSQIGIRFYLEMPETVLEDSAAYVSIDGVKFPVSTAPTSSISGKTYYTFTIYVKIAELTQQHLLRVFSGTDEPVALLDRQGADYTDVGYSYAAQQYIEAARATGDAKLIRLVNALSDLGSLAQQYFKVDVENRAEVQADLSAVTLDSASQYAAKVDVKDGTGLNYVGASLLLREDVTIRHYFKVTGDISQYTFKVDGKKVTPIQKDNYYYVEIGNIFAVDLDKDFHVEVSTSANGVIAEIDYCALSYAYKQLKKGEESVLTDLIRTLVLYSQEADTYFGT